MTVKFNVHGQCRVIFYDNDGSWNEPMIFDSLDDALSYCEEMIDYNLQVRGADIFDVTTNNWLAYCEADWKDEEPADIDDDCGFDPYEGCFTYDC